MKESPIPWVGTMSTCARVWGYHEHVRGARVVEGQCRQRGQQEGERAPQAGGGAVALKQAVTERCHPRVVVVHGVVGGVA